MASYPIIPEGLNLYPFQLTTVEKSVNFLKTFGGCYVGNEQGLGKTVTSLCAVNALKDENAKILVLCPAIMRLTWEAEIYKWCRFNSHDVIPVAVLEASKSLKEADLDRARFVICSYSLSINKAVLTALLRFKWDVLISDENHMCKDFRRKRTKAFFALAKNSKYKILMSGTAFSKNVVDFFAPCHLLAPRIFPSFNNFAERYSECTEESVPVYRFGKRMSIMVKKYHGLKNAPELSKIVRDRFFIRYKKEEVLPELPPKIFQKIILPESYSVKVSQKERAKIEAEKQLFLQAFESRQGVPAPQKIQSLAQHRRLQGEEKVSAVAEFVKDKLEEGIPIVLFAYHHSVINKLSCLLSEFNPVVVTGDTPYEERQKAINAFQSGNASLFIGNLLAAGAGITLTASSTVVLAELDWIPTNLAQAVDRVHRIGQKNQVVVYWFEVENSLDTRMNELIMERTKEAAAVLDAK